ncbi:MAG: carboxypeptidase regulatory-like domain-containing protein, partial [Capsulimonadaceae bacterium]
MLSEFARREGARPRICLSVVSLTASLFLGFCVLLSTSSMTLASPSTRASRAVHSTLFGATLVAPSPAVTPAQTRTAPGLMTIDMVKNLISETRAHRFLYPRSDLVPDKPGPGLRYSRDPTTGSIIIPEPVQTNDVLNPTPTFTPTTSSGALTGINIEPCWTKDDSYIVFSSNMGDNVHYHIWIVPSIGGTPVQITGGAPGNGLVESNDTYPVLSADNRSLAFVSDAAPTGSTNTTTNIFTMPFNETTMLALTTPIDVVTSSAVTQQTSSGNQSMGVGFAGVGRPAWSPDNLRLAFSAQFTNGESHLYYLYTSSQGYLETTPTGQTNPPGRLTNGTPTAQEHVTDVAWSPDGNYIAFSSDVATYTNSNDSPPILPDPTAPDDSNTPVLATAQTSAPLVRAIFVLNQDGSIPQNSSMTPVTSTAALTKGPYDTGPAWSFLNSKLPASTGLIPYGGYLAFSRGDANPPSLSDIYYYWVEENINNQNTLTQYNLTTEAAYLVANGLTTLPPVNTSDNSPTQTWYNMYPTWSPLLSHVHLGYQTNRSITYNNPTATATAPAGAPSETPFNLTPANYGGVFTSEITNLNPPTLIRYEPGGGDILNVVSSPISQSTNEPVYNPTGPATRFIPAGSAVTFTVRLSNRETGVDSSHVFIQIKNPNSKYDDSQLMEHKEFANDNPPTSTQDTDYNNPDMTASGAVPFVPQFGQVSGYSMPYVYSKSLLYYNIVDFATTLEAETGGNIYWYNRGSDVGPAQGSTLGLGLGTYQWQPGEPLGFKVETTGLFPGLSAWGPEYECQALLPNYEGVGLTGTGSPPQGGTPLSKDYYRPYYLAGWNDDVPQTGPSTTPAQWLQLSPVLAADQDTNGGTLYTATWFTPLPESDFYIDVIAYDQAKLAKSVKGITGENWRIYDNVWGFTTKPFTGSHDILVVSDNTLGQKFAASQYEGSSNLRATLWGTESYYTGIDELLLPNAVTYYDIPPKPAAAPPDVPYIAPIVNGDYDNNILNCPVPGDLGQYGPSVFNTLGPGSYPGQAPTINDPYAGPDPAPSQLYDIWRTLSRGPVDQTVLMSYAPAMENQPAVDDPATKIVNPAANFANANKCVVWATPYTGDLFVGGGSFASPTTQEQIETFLNAGGRLYVSGQDVGSTITDNGTINNSNPNTDFLPAYLGCTWLGITKGSQVLPLAGTSADRLITDAFFNPIVIVNGNAGSSEDWTWTAGGNGYARQYTPPSKIPDGTILANELNYDVAITAWLPGERADGCPDEFMGNIFEVGVGTGWYLNYDGLYYASLQGAIDVLGPIPTTPTPDVILNTHSDLTVTTTTPAGNSLIYYENPSTLSRVVYSSFGLEGLGIEIFSTAVPQSSPQTYFYQTYNRRANLMHNIVAYLRSGTVTGYIYQQTGSGGDEPVSGATVYLTAQGNVAIPGMPPNRTVYSGITGTNGEYVIDCVDSGLYVLHAYMTGYTSTTSNVWIGVEGDCITRENLTLTEIPPGAISGEVTDPAGNPQKGATVTFTATGTTVSATTASDGTYTVENVPAGLTYSGIATDGTESSAANQNVVVTSGENTPNVNFQLVGANGSLTGVVTAGSKSGPGIPGATVTLTPPAGSGLTTLTTTTSSTGTIGSYSFPDIPAGTQATTTWSLEVTAATFIPSATTTVQITEGAAQTQNIILQSGSPGYLGGLVSGSMLATSIGGITVTVSTATTPPAATYVTTSTTTTPPAPQGDGSPVNYSGALPSGSYTLTANDNATTTTAQPITVTAGQFTRVNFSVPTGVIFFDGARRKLVGQAYLLTGDFQEAQDLVQEVLLRVW